MRVRLFYTDAMPPVHIPLNTAIKSIYRIWFFAIAALTIIVTIALASGQYHIPITDIFAMLMRKLGLAMNATNTHNAREIDIIIFDLRLPRIIAAFCVGATLAAAGAAYQNLFRNPLVSPDILGVSSGAALGAVVGIFLALPLLLIQLSAFAGGLAAVAFIYMISRAIDANNNVLTLVLIGVVVASLLGAGVSLIKYLADPYQQLPAITYWLMGSFAGVSRNELAVALPLMMIGLLPLFLLRWRINILSLADDEARALGLNLAATRLIVILAATLITASAVAICGVIGWVGLIIPHAVRLLVGAEFSRLLPLCLIIGGTFMLLVDTLCRSLGTIEIPPGVITAVIGAPIFIGIMTATFRRQ
jgi:iron complex transport system permease protein